MLSLSSLTRAAVLAAHPDDEIIGPGGTVHRLAREGAEVTVVTFTCGETAADCEADASAMAEARRAEMARADELLGLAGRHVLAVPSQQVYRAVHADNRLHHELIRLLRQWRPQLVLAHARDNHRDHCAVAEIAPQAVFQAGEAILGSLGEPWRAGTLLSYGVEREVPGPNIVVRIAEDDLAAKVEALRAQLSQARRGYLDRLVQMVRAQARLWGARQFGPGELAEAFHVDSAHPLRVE